MLSLDLADLIITQANAADQPISNLHLQRILYFLHVQAGHQFWHQPRGDRSC